MIQKSNKTCLMSIKPQYYNLIANRVKKVEYRKVAPKLSSQIFLYVSSPVKKICGVIITEQIITDSVENIWKMTKLISGISHNDFKAYCGKKENVTAIIIKDFKPLEPLNPSDIIKGFRAPQNFIYNEKLSTLV